MISLGIIHRYLLKMVFYPIIVSLLLFSFFVQMIDILTNLLRYLIKEVPLSTILQIQYLYIPTSISFALPISILFSISFTVSNFYAHNELISIYCSGISLLKFVQPLLILGLILSIANFFFKENVVINSAKKRTEIIRQVLYQKRDKSNVDVVASQDGIIYRANYYDDTNISLSQVTIIETKENTFFRRIDANIARWKTNKWVFEDAKLYTYNKNTRNIDIELINSFSNPTLNLSPELFKKTANNVDDMRYDEALAYIKSLKKTGQPYRKLLTNIYSRIPWAISPLIVMIIACFAANSYGKNTFLMSLLTALITAVIYYSSDLIGTVLASRQILPPIMGAWFGVFIISIVSVGLYKITSK